MSTGVQYSNHPCENIVHKHTGYKKWRGRIMTRYKIYPNLLNRLKRVETGSPQITAHIFWSFAKGMARTILFSNRGISRIPMSMVSTPSIIHQQLIFAQQRLLKRLAWICFAGVCKFAHIICYNLRLAVEMSPRLSVPEGAKSSTLETSDWNCFYQYCYVEPKKCFEDFKVSNDLNQVFQNEVHVENKPA